VIQTDGDAEQVSDQDATTKRFRQLGLASRTFISITCGLTPAFMLLAWIDVAKSDKLRPIAESRSHFLLMLTHSARAEDFLVSIPLPSPTQKNHDQ
jgi:hypothetical protein